MKNTSLERIGFFPKKQNYLIWMVSILWFDRFTVIKQQRYRTTFILLACKEQRFKNRQQEIRRWLLRQVILRPPFTPCQWWPAWMVTRNKTVIYYCTLSQKVLEKWQNRMLLNDKTYLEALFKNLSLFIIKVTRLLHTNRQTVNIGNFH